MWSDTLINTTVASTRKQAHTGTQVHYTHLCLCVTHNLYIGESSYAKKLASHSKPITDTLYALSSLPQYVAVKKRKVDAERRVLQGKWSSFYFLMELNGKAVCLVGSQHVAVLKVKWAEQSDPNAARSGR